MIEDDDGRDSKEDAQRLLSPDQKDYLYRRLIDKTIRLGITFAYSEGLRCKSSTKS